MAIDSGDLVHNYQALSKAKSSLLMELPYRHRLPLLPVRDWSHEWRSQERMQLVLVIPCATIASEPTTTCTRAILGDLILEIVDWSSAALWLRSLDVLAELSRLVVPASIR